MTTITFGQGFVGFAFQHLNNVSHRWEDTHYHLRTNQPNYRNVLTNELDKREKWQDCRDFKWFWSPDGNTANRVYCDTVDEAVALVNSTWYLEPPTAIKHAPEDNGYALIFGDLERGITEVIGPFLTSLAADEYGDRVRSDDEVWATKPITGPLVQYVDK